jgi:dihydrolipoamide dehydrogenase
MTHTTPTTNLLVIGAGPGGYVAAIRAAQHGIDVTLVDDAGYGGTCLNHGCIPSKALLTATERIDWITDAEDKGIYVEPYVDFGELMSWKDEVVDRLTGGVEQLCAANGVTVVDGRARFVDEHTIAIADDELEFERAVLATGSRPIEIPGFEFDAGPILDARQVLALETLPPRLVIVGAGYIGMELATVFARLGTAVTVVEMLDSPLPGYDDDLVAPVAASLRDRGVEFHFGYAANEWETTDSGVRVVAEDADGGQLSVEGTHVLVAVGREPVTDTVDAERVGIETDEDGAFATDGDHRTALDHVFAVGDAAGDPLLAHAASHEGAAVADLLAGRADGVPDRAIPAVAFTDPEVATVGLTPTEAAERYEDTLVGEFSFSASGRALTAGTEEGFVRLVADSDGTIVGGQLVGPEASELVAEVGVAVERSLTVDELGSTVHAHPTLGEAVMEAAHGARGHATHTLNR